MNGTGMKNEIQRQIQALDLSDIYKVKIAGRWLTGPKEWCEDQRDRARVKGQRPSQVVKAYE